MPEEAKNKHLELKEGTNFKDQPDVNGTARSESNPTENTEQSLGGANEPNTCQARNPRLQNIRRLMQIMAHNADTYARQIWKKKWQLVSFRSLPEWLRDNELLLRGHRPQLHTVWSCFQSVFRVHTETGNIWTHLLGCACFIAIAIFFSARPDVLVQWQEKLVLGGFFAGAMLCFGFSCLLHTAVCYSERACRFLSKLDYCGIALLSVSSFVPYIYYAFYCTLWAKLFYWILMVVLGAFAIFVSMWDKFASSAFRPLRAGVFVALGLSGLAPCIHFTVIHGFWSTVLHGSLDWVLLTAVLYITGAVLFATRIPERCLPGRFDFWFQSHQIFHTCAVAGTIVHYHAIAELADYRLTIGDCLPPREFLLPKHELDNVHLLRPFMTKPPGF